MCTAPDGTGSLPRGWTVRTHGSRGPLSDGLARPGPPVLPLSGASFHRSATFPAPSAPERPPDAADPTDVPTGRAPSLRPRPLTPEAAHRWNPPRGRLSVQVSVVQPKLVSVCLSSLSAPPAVSPPLHTQRRPPSLAPSIPCSRLSLRPSGCARTQPASSCPVSSSRSSRLVPQTCPLPLGPPTRPPSL